MYEMQSGGYRYTHEEIIKDTRANKSFLFGFPRPVASRGVLFHVAQGEEHMKTNATGIQRLALKPARLRRESTGLIPWFHTI